MCVVIFAFITFHQRIGCLPPCRVSFLRKEDNLVAVCKHMIKLKRHLRRHAIDNVDEDDGGGQECDNATAAASANVIADVEF